MLYAYVGANPINMVDPHGLDAKEVLSVVNQVNEELELEKTNLKSNAQYQAALEKIWGERLENTKKYTANVYIDNTTGKVLQVGGDTGPSGGNFRQLDLIEHKKGFVIEVGMDISSSNTSIVDIWDATVSDKSKGKQKKAIKDLLDRELKIAKTNFKLELQNGSWLKKVNTGLIVLFGLIEAKEVGSMYLDALLYDSQRIDDIIREIENALLCKNCDDMASGIIQAADHLISYFEDCGLDTISAGLNRVAIQRWIVTECIPGGSK